MGCDIHLLFETKTDKGWREIPMSLGLCPDDRNYQLFSFLADIRGDLKDPYKGLFANRGLPKDISVLNPIDEYDGLFGETYATLEELWNAPWEKAELDGCYFHIFCMHVWPRLVTVHGYLSAEKRKNHRVIMAFDN